MAEQGLVERKGRDLVVVNFVALLEAAAGGA